jgi:hypothetical protein
LAQGGPSRFANKFDAMKLPRRPKSFEAINHPLAEQDGERKRLHKVIERLVCWAP